MLEIQRDGVGFVFGEKSTSQWKTPNNVISTLHELYLPPMLEAAITQASFSSHVRDSTDDSAVRARSTLTLHTHTQQSYTKTTL